MEITNKCARNVKRTIKTSDVALLLTESVESFAIAILNALIDCEFLRLTVLYNELCFLCLLLACVHDSHSSFYSRLTSSILINHRSQLHYLQ